jgi:hypothetical protein
LSYAPALTIGDPIMGAFPLLLIPFALMNALMFFSDGGLSQAWFNPVLPSGANFVLTAGDVGVLVGLLFLYFEVLKSTRAGVTSVLDHVLSLSLFVVCLLEFLLVPKAANSAFLALTAMTLGDVISGFTVSISVARRDIGFGPTR